MFLCDRERISSRFISSERLITRGGMPWHCLHSVSACSRVLEHNKVQLLVCHKSHLGSSTKNGEICSPPCATTSTDLIYEQTKAYFIKIKWQTGVQLHNCSSVCFQFRLSRSLHERTAAARISELGGFRFGNFN